MILETVKRLSDALKALGLELEAALKAESESVAAAAAEESTAAPTAPPDPAPPDVSAPAINMEPQSGPGLHNTVPA